MNSSVQSGVTGCLGSTAGEYVMKKGASIAFFSVMIDTAMDVLQKVV
jgi:hypothetical protein